jgi:hypothetical protein
MAWGCGGLLGFILGVVAVTLAGLGYFIWHEFDVLGRVVLAFLAACTALGAWYAAKGYRYD